MKDLSKTQLNKNKDKLLKFRWYDLHFSFMWRLVQEIYISPSIQFPKNVIPYDNRLATEQSILREKENLNSLGIWLPGLIYNYKNFETFLESWNMKSHFTVFFSPEANGIYTLVCEFVQSKCLIVVFGLKLVHTHFIYISSQS